MNKIIYSISKEESKPYSVYSASLESLHSTKFFNVVRIEDTVNSNPEWYSGLHAHNFYTIFFVTKGSAVQYIEDDKYKILDSIFFIPPGRCHKFVDVKSVKGFLINFSEDFFLHIDQHIVPIIKRGFFQKTQETAIQNMEQFVKERLVNIMENMVYYFSSTESDILYYSSLGALFSLFLITCYREYPCTKIALPQNDAHYELLVKFNAMVEANYHVQHDVVFYVKSLQVSSKVLYDVTSRYSDAKPLDILQNRIVLEAKRRLCFTSDTIKEIAFGLGFPENSNFVRFFKRKCGITPGKYRKMYMDEQNIHK